MNAVQTDLADIPNEIMEEMLCHLPITPPASLLAIAFASKTYLGSHLLTVQFARRHFRAKLAQSEFDFWQFLAEAGLKNHGFVLLPLHYKAAIYSEVLSAPDWVGIYDLSHADEENANLMWSEDWSLPEPNTLFMFQTIHQQLSFDFSCGNNRAIRWMCRSGYLEVVKYLLQDPRVDPTDDCLPNAAEFGRYNIVAYLMKDSRVDPSAGHKYSIRGDPTVKKPLSNYAIRFACLNGHKDIVELLLTDERVDPSAEANVCLCNSAWHGFADIVELLLKDPRVDIATQDNYAMHVACQNGHLAVARVLMADKKMDRWFAQTVGIAVAQNNQRTAIVNFLRDYLYEEEDSSDSS
ncbi:UNVERIFIED_CONTAM: hypothetical protein HDU68_008268 [Siphonaria sp. JEL0065]|nr:hypothetical protein HDU68_008268 [Siphonaria sp. JEL0065]